MSLTQKISATPFLRILPFVVAGVVMADSFAIPLWILWLSLIAAYACAWLTMGKSTVGWIYTAASITLTAMVLTRAHATRPELPENQAILMHLKVTDNPLANGRWDATSARVGYYHTADGEWLGTDQKIVLNADTSLHVAVGGEYICRGYVSSLRSRSDSVASGYEKLMNARGYWGRTYITADGIVARAPEHGVSPSTLAKRMQAAASERLAKLSLSPEEMSIAAAMTTGERRAMPSRLKQSYSRVGASHLLAVSGLHVGIIFMLINALLYLLPLVRRGHIVKNLIAIVAVWAFTAMTGLSPSVVRAALMFTGAQIALAATRPGATANILLATVSVMLLLEPYSLWDVSFQLSVAAVMSIAVLYKPMYSRIKTHWKLINAFAGVFVAGVAATVGTAPLVAYHFHNLPLIGIFVNPPLIFTSTAVVLLSMAWIMFPIGFMSGLVGGALGIATDVQNRIVEWSASLPGAAVEVHITVWQTYLIYASYIALLSGAALRERKKSALELL